eukprot:gene6242-8597_t
MQNSFRQCFGYKERSPAGIIARKFQFNKARRSILRISLPVFMAAGISSAASTIIDSISCHHNIENANLSLILSIIYAVFLYITGKILYKVVSDLPDLQQLYLTSKESEEIISFESDAMAFPVSFVLTVLIAEVILFANSSSFLFEWETNYEEPESNISQYTFVYAFTITVIIAIRRVVVSLVWKEEEEDIDKETNDTTTNNNENKNDDVNYDSSISPIQNSYDNSNPDVLNNTVLSITSKSDKFSSIELDKPTSHVNSLYKKPIKLFEIWNQTVDILADYYSNLEGCFAGVAVFVAIYDTFGHDFVFSGFYNISGFISTLFVVTWMIQYIPGVTAKRYSYHTHPHYFLPDKNKESATNQERKKNNMWCNLLCCTRATNENSSKSSSFFTPVYKTYDTIAKERNKVVKVSLSLTMGLLFESLILIGLDVITDISEGSFLTLDQIAIIHSVAAFIIIVIGFGIYIGFDLGNTSIENENFLETKIRNEISNPNNLTTQNPLTSPTVSNP